MVKFHSTFCHVISSTNIFYGLTINPHARCQMFMCSRVDHGGKISMHIQALSSTSMLATVGHVALFLFQQSN